MTGPEIIDRLARRRFEAAHHYRDDVQWETISQDERLMWINDTQQFGGWLLDAIREPSAAMMSASLAACPDCYQDGMAPTAVWRAMIDALRREIGG